MRCKNCNIKFEQYEFNNKFCKSIDCQTAKAMYLLEKKKKADKKAWNKEKKERKKVLEAPKYKKYLQDEINKLARMIDAKFTNLCIDCNKPFNTQTDAAHYHNRKGNENIRYHLDNLHSARSNCNMYDSEHKKGYAIGLEERYGKEYLEWVENLGSTYPYLGLNAHEVYEKLTLVRKLIRDFDTYKLENPIQARKMFNKIIGIYK